MQLDCRNAKKNKLFSNNSLASLAEQLEIARERVKDLQIFQLIEPIKAVLIKLKELDELIDKLHLSKHYGDYAGPDQDGRKELGKSICASACPQSAPVQRTRREPASSSGSSCDCHNSQGERSCHCGSSRGSLPAGKLEPNLHKTETYCIKDAPKCSPCKCPVDASGKRRKSQDCKQAARARRESREARPRTADATLTSVPDSDLLLVGNTLSQTMIKVEASWPEKTFKFTKEDRHCQQDATERGILCNMSSESSSGQSTLSSSDNAYPMLNCQQRDRRRSPRKLAAYESDSTFEAYGYGRADADNACPCGCGDLKELPERTREPRSHCWCENCGKEITEGDQEAATCRAADRERREPRQKSAGNSRCGKLREDSRTGDIQKYIEELEEKCRIKDNIITQLQDQLININERCC